MAVALSQQILGQRIDGIWHTGIVVFGKEYYFGGGIQVMDWGYFARSNNMNPMQVLDMGTTQKSRQEFENYLRTINNQYTSYTYDLLNNNCNNFADTICRFLTGHGIPSHIVDLPRIVFSTPGGAMLRPMIENMQNSIRQQQGFALDPFGQPTAAVPQGQFESTLADSVTSLAMNALQNTATSEALKMAELEELPLISGDASTVSAVGLKILNLPDKDGVKGKGLTEEEKVLFSSILQRLSSSRFAGKKPDFTLEDYAFMEKILANHPEVHMAALFTLRIMFLHDNVTDFNRLAIVHDILGRLLGKAPSSSGSSPTTPFASVAAHVMALCAISNLLSHDNGKSYLLGDTTAAVDASATSIDLFNSLVDVSLSGLSNERQEVRQMSATLAYNLTLACTKENQLSGPWKAESGSSDEINAHALQLLCGSLEGITEEKDAAVRKRRLSTTLRIARCFKEHIASLLNDLGFNDFLQILKTDRDIKPALSNEERTIVDEILHYLK